jgi:hypothetical protein
MTATPIIAGALARETWQHRTDFPALRDNRRFQTLTPAGLRWEQLWEDGHAIPVVSAADDPDTLP